MFFLSSPSPTWRGSELHATEKKPGARGQQRVSEGIKVQGQQGDSSAAVNSVVSFQ